MRRLTVWGAAGVAFLGCSVRHGPGEIASAQSWVRFEPGTAAVSAKQTIAAASGELDAYFSERLATAAATGLAAGLVVDGELVYAKGFGVQDIETGAPVGTDTVFRIASLTKSFTAMAALRLRDEGRLALDLPAAEYVSELATLRGLTKDAPPVTARMLLTHAAGLPWDDQWGAVSFGFSDEDRDALLHRGLSLAKTPGESLEYSNLGYAILGMIVERISGTPFRSYVTREILEPLGMTSTVWESRDVSPARLAVGYRRGANGLTPELRVASAFFAPAGGLYTSLRDYARYMAFQLSAYPARDEAEAAPLRRSTVREMHHGVRPWMLHANVEEGGRVSLYKGDYGFGWIESTTCQGDRQVEHSGWEPGYFSSVILLPERHLGVVSLATSHGVRATIGAIELLRKLEALPPKQAPQPSQELEAARKAVASLFREWDPALVSTTFDPASSHYEWFPKMGENLARMHREHGSCDFSGPMLANDRLHGQWRAACEKGALAFEVFLTPSVPSRIALLAWHEREANHTDLGEAICSP
jgi:CubicO group peptidase (beta-lactamase class C family)